MEIEWPMLSWSVTALPFAAAIDAIEDVHQEGLINVILEGRAKNWQALLAGARATMTWMLICLFVIPVTAR